MATAHDRVLENGQQWEEAKIEPVPATQSPAIKWAIDIVRPAWFRAGRRSKQLRPTAYLDGLRGFAAFMVYILHHQLWAHDALNGARILENTFGYEGRYYFACLVGIRTFFSGGHYAVTVFFVISGYVLSTKPLSLIQAGEHLKLGDNIASALFRRWLRLFIPVIAVSFVWMSSWHLFGIHASNPIPQSNYYDEIWMWYAEFKNFSFVFKTEGELWFNYHFHAWSIPMEFRGSIVIYTALLAFSRCTRTARLWCEAGMCFYFLYIVDGWFCALFSAGMLICDLDLLAAKDNLPAFFSVFKPYQSIIWPTVFVCSVYLGGVPSHSIEIEDMRKQYGWYYLSLLKPQAVFNPKWFYLFWASTSLVACIRHLAWLKAFFETGFIQYLGRVSFALYLVHGPVLWTIGDRIYAACGMIRASHGLDVPGWINIFPMPAIGPLGLELRFLVPHLIILPITLWFAEIVTKLFDEPSVKFVQWLYKCVLPSTEKS